MSLDDVRKRIRPLDAAETLLVCIGNDLKADDAAGPLLYEALRGSVVLPMINAATVPENYIRKIIARAPRTLIVVDAIDFGARPGEIAVLDPSEIKGVTTSTHVLSPVMFVEMIAAEIPIDPVFIAIQPQSTELAQPVSPEVAASVRSLASLLAEAFPIPGA